ncbi:hypothetical protein OIU77_008418, partial [Salix suchowensis]
MGIIYLFLSSSFIFFSHLRFLYASNISGICSISLAVFARLSAAILSHLCPFHLGSHFFPLWIIWPVFPREKDFLAKSCASATTDVEWCPGPKIPVTPHAFGELILVLCQLLFPWILVLCNCLCHSFHSFACHSSAPMD